jgi:dephospho-CoA kinase
MIESGGYRRFDELIVVWCEPDLQLTRLMSRDGLSEADAAKRIASQMSQEEKKKHADYLIDTSKGFEDARRQIAEVLRRLRLSR